MSDNMLSLDDIRRELENKYAPYRFTNGDQVFVLVPVMRLKKEDRKKVQEKLKVLDSGNDDLDEDGVVEALEFALATVTKDRQGRALVRELGGDLALLMDIFERYQAATQTGEASSSQN